MSWNSYLQNNNGTGSDLYPRDGYRKNKLIIIAIVVGLFILIIVLAFVQSGRDRYVREATTAARKVTPNAAVSNPKVAGGFAMSSVSSPTASGQEKSGIITIFKVNKDGSMTQVASGSSFSPLNLLELDIPLATQAKLTGQTVSEVKQTLANVCDYTGDNTPGYSGFDGSFSPDGWQIDSATLDGIEQTLSVNIGNKNVKVNVDQKIICVNATGKNSNATTNTQTYISSFTLELQFIAGDGTVTNHIFTFSIGPNYYRSYTLDGQKI